MENQEGSEKTAGDASRATEWRESQDQENEATESRAETTKRHAAKQQGSQPEMDPGQMAHPKSEDDGRKAEDRFAIGGDLAGKLEVCGKIIRGVEEARKRDREQMEGLRGQVLDNSRKEARREKGEAKPYGEPRSQMEIRSGWLEDMEAHNGARDAEI